MLCIQLSVCLLARLSISHAGEHRRLAAPFFNGFCLSANFEKDFFAVPN